MNELGRVWAVAAKERRGYRPDIDGLRAFAVTAVVLFHAGLFPFRSGFIGVDVFFVISGYLIGGIILRDASAQRFSFMRFYARRARRILPALCLVVLAVCLAGYVVLDANEMKDIGALGTVALLGVSNINFWQFQDYFAGDSRLRVLLMTWSLGVEEQFYLIFPFLILLTWRSTRPVLLGVIGAISLASFAVSLWWTWHAPQAAFYLLPARAWELGCGALLAAWEVRGGFSLSNAAQDILAALGASALAVGAVAFDEHTPFPGVLALLPVAGAAALIVSPRSYLNRALLNGAPLRGIGLVSYSWYLWHWPVMSVMRTVAPLDLPPFVFALSALISLLLAILTWCAIEQPFRRGRLQPGVALACYALVLACVLAIPMAARRSGGFPWRLSPQTQRLEVDVAALRRGQCLVPRGGELLHDADCESRPPGRPVIALVGDSHAWALGPALRTTAARQGFGYTIMTRAACPPLKGVTVRSPNFETLEADCPVYNAAVIATIAADPSITTVMVAGYWSAPLKAREDEGYISVEANRATRFDVFRTGLEGTLAALTKAGKHVIVMQDVPNWTFSPLKVAIADSMPPRHALAVFLDPTIARLDVGWVPAAEVTRNAAVVQAVAAIAAKAGAQLVDPYPNFCDALRCTFRIGNDPLYFDEHHLAPSGADLAMRGLQLAITR